MIGHYLNTFFRQFNRNKTYQLISVLGLALGIAGVILMVAWIRFETSFDTFFSKADRLYRITEVQEYPTGNLDVAVTPFPLGPALVRDFPEVESAARVYSGGDLILSRGDKRFFETEPLYVDSTFLDMFSFAFRYGDASGALDQKYSAVLTEEVANKYFGDANPVGQTIRVDNKYDLTVTGVLEPLPSNTHMDFGLLIAMPTVSDDWTQERKEAWGRNAFATYVALKEHVDVAAFSTRLERILYTYRDSTNSTRLFAQPVPSIHLGPTLVADNATTADPKRLSIFSFAAILVLLIACINYINLATARASLRGKEFGVRTCLGAGRNELRRQILLEAFTASAVACLLAVVLVELGFSWYRSILGTALTRSELISVHTVVAALVSWLATGVLAGAYPALVLSRLTPGRLFKEQKSKGKQLRSVLVVTQFAVSITLILVTLVVVRQQQFMKNTRLAMTSEQVLILPLRGEEAREKTNSLREALHSVNGVSSVAAMAQLPNQIVWSSDYAWEGQEPGSGILLNENPVDYGFVETFGLELVAGRNFNKAEDNVCLINETALRATGWAEPLGRTFDMGTGTPTRVVGVVKDFHYSSLRDEIGPLLLYPREAAYTAFPYSSLAVRMTTDNLEQTVDHIKQIFAQLAPSTPFSSLFFDETFERLYRSEQRMQRTVMLFACLAIFLACLGLYGLATYSIERRTKEVGIRKVLGATVQNIVTLHTREFVLWLVIANAIAWPVGYWLSQQWLASFAYRTTLPWWLFAAAGVITLLLALVTVAAQTVKAALANPIRSLRYE